MSKRRETSNNLIGYKPIETVNKSIEAKIVGQFTPKTQFDIKQTKIFENDFSIT